MQKLVVALGVALVGLAVVGDAQAPQTQPPSAPQTPTTPATLQQAIDVENKMYEHKLSTGELTPMEHKRSEATAAAEDSKK